MSLSFSRKIAQRYLWSKRSEAFISIITIISILGVAIGVMVITMAMSIMNGFEHELREKIIGTESHIVVEQIGGRLKGWPELVEKISKVEGVTSVSPFTYNQALLRTDASSSGILIKGVAQGTASAAQLATYIEEGQNLNTLFSEPQADDGVSGMIVGRELLLRSGLMIGSTISLISPQVGSSPLGLIPRFKRFKVSASYKSGLTEYENSLAYMRIEDAQRFFRLGDAVTGLEVRVDKIDDAPLISKRIMEKLGGLSKGLMAKDWTSSNRALWDAIRLEKRVYFLVLLLIIVMASFSIVSTLVLLVMEKRGDIAILRTLGAPSRAIGNIFRLQGAIIGGVGTLFGLLLGVIGCLGLKQYGFDLDERLFQLSQVPVRMDPINFIFVGVAAFLICLTATIYPASRASKLDPAEVLRYE